MTVRPWICLLVISFVGCFWIGSTDDDLVCRVRDGQDGYCLCDIQGLSGSAVFDLRPLFASGTLET